MSINFKNIYNNKLLRVSYKNDNNFEKVVTGRIVSEDLNFIVILSVKNETITIRKNLIGNIIELVERCNKDAKVN